MSQTSLHVAEVKDRAATATLIEKWEKTLVEGGLSAELDPIIPEEVQELFPMDSENVADDFEPLAGTVASSSSEDAAKADVTVCEEITLTQIERRIVERLKALGWAATLEETNATSEQIARLADSGAAFLRATDSGQAVLAMAGATDGDVRRAARRITKPEVREFTANTNRPRTPAVMFLEHHSDEKVPGEEAKVRAAEEFRNSCRVATARDVLLAHGGRLTKEAKVELANRLFGETLRRAREGGPELGEGFRREVKRSLVRAVTEALKQINGGRSDRQRSWREDPASRERFARRLAELSKGGGRCGREQRWGSYEARLNSARAIYTASLGHATYRILHVLRRDGRMTLAELRRRFSSETQEVNDALVKLAASEKVRKLRSRKTGEVFIEATSSMNEVRYRQALRRILASRKCGLRYSGASPVDSPGRRAAA